jgi:8-oxo-dGTP pyrophosphatase MutT (NUDIX family)
MKLLYTLKDEAYPFTFIDHTRACARGVVIDENGNIALTKLLFTDIFGHRDYYELPGGGVREDETIEQAFLREMEEETGYAVSILDEIGEVSDYYNLIHRHNRNYYYLAHTINYVGQRLEPKEIDRIEQLLWVPIDKAISLFESMNDASISGLVKRRELPILKLAKELMHR